METVSFNLFGPIYFLSCGKMIFLHLGEGFLGGGEEEGGGEFPYATLWLKLAVNVRERGCFLNVRENNIVRSSTSPERDRTRNFILDSNPFNPGLHF